MGVSAMFLWLEMTVVGYRLPHRQGLTRLSH